MWLVIIIIFIIYIFSPVIVLTHDDLKLNGWVFMVAYIGNWIVPFFLPHIATMNGWGWGIFILFSVLLAGGITYLLYKIEKNILVCAISGFHTVLFLGVIILLVTKNVATHDGEVVFTAPLKVLEPQYEGCPDTTYLQIINDKYEYKCSSAKCPYRCSDSTLIEIENDKVAYFECYEVTATPGFRK